MNQIEYADSAGAHLAFQISGDGPLDLILVPGFISHVDFRWQEPSLARFLNRLGTFARVIAYDKRGMGLSDRDPADTTPTLDQRVGDVGAVLDAAASSRSVVMAWSEGGATAIRFALRYPQRVAGLILIGTAARFTSTTGYPDGISQWRMKLAIELGRAKWGTGVGLQLYAPSRADDSRFMAWWAAYQRYSSSPGAVANSLRLHLEVDVRGDLSGLQVPALVLHRVDDLVVPVELGRSLATDIPGAIYHELSGADHIYWLGDQWETLDAIRGFLAGTPDGTAVQAVKSRRRRPSSGWDALTSTELEVVRAVGNGYTNRQIAVQLRMGSTAARPTAAELLAVNKSGAADKPSWWHPQVVGSTAAG